MEERKKKYWVVDPVVRTVIIFVGLFAMYAFLSFEVSVLLGLSLIISDTLSTLDKK